jgi:hypothetical protein
LAGLPPKQRFHFLAINKNEKKDGIKKTKFNAPAADCGRDPETGSVSISTFY